MENTQNLVLFRRVRCVVVVQPFAVVFRAIPQYMQTLFSEKLQRNRTILTTCQSDTL